jgi:hypothetical protein
MKYFACRYYETVDHWSVVLYSRKGSVTAHPHDYDLYFTAAEWKKVYGKAPGKDETLVVKLTATPEDR